MNNFQNFLSNYETETTKEKLLFEVIAELITTVERQQQEINRMENRWVKFYMEGRI